MNNKNKKQRIKKIKFKIIHVFKKICDGIVIRKLKQCGILLVSFVKAFLEIFITKKYDDTYVSLTPIKNADKDGMYYNAMKYAIDNPEIKNIAISGNYGSGKSSVIQTFFDKLENKKYNPIYVSLGAFNKNDYIEKVSNRINENNEENVKEIQNKNEFYHTLEKSILQQLIYQADESDIPLSRFKRISKHSKVLLNIETLLAISAIVILVCIVFPDIIQGTIDNYNSITNKISQKLVNGLLGILVIVIYYMMYKAIFFLSTKFNVSKFKLKDAEVEIDNKPESIFNKYLDEIIYFFQVTNHNVVIIEDLDRYEGDASFIFQKLRELNTLINSSSQVKYEVDFIFAIRDDFFEDYEERTKFFDYIIPIIPISSNGNSNEIMWKRLENLRNSGKINYKFDKSFIDDITIMIEDKRLIDNIINEFIIYKNKFNNKHMDDKQLLSIIMYKNICPKSYADLQKNSGNIVEILKNKQIKIIKIISELDKQKEVVNSEKEKVIKETLNSVKELKMVLISSIYNYTNYLSYERAFKFNNESVNINEFLASSTNIEKISSSTISFGTERYGYFQLNENEVFKIFGNKTMFIERWKKIEKGRDIKLKELQEELEELNSKISNIKKLSIEQLVKQYGTEDIYDKNTKPIEKFLIAKGYVTEEYKDYITLFVPGNLTKEDNEFVFAVKTGECLPYEYKLNNIENILKKLNENDFDTNCILNFDLLNYLINNNINDKVLKIIQILDESDENALLFIDDFIEKYVPSKTFIDLLTGNSIKLWKKIFKKIGKKEYIDKWVVRFLINEHALMFVDENFKEYVNKHMDLDKYIDNENIEIVIKSLKYLGIRLSNIQNINNKNFMNQIYLNELYELNTTMIKHMLFMNNIDVKLFGEKNLSIILNYDGNLKNYVLNNFEEYFDSCYTLNNSNKDDESSIMEILKNEDIDIEIKKKIVKNEEFKKYKLDNLNVDLIETILTEDKMNVDYDNVLLISEKYESLESNLINHIGKHIDKYSCQNINECDNKYDKEIIDSFINKYIFNKELELKDFKKLVLTFNYKVKKLEEIDLSKLEYLIDNQLIEFNIDNFKYIKNNVPHKLLKYISDNIEKFIEKIEEYDISEIKDNLLLYKDISIEDKIKIIEHIEVSDLANKTIINLILKKIIVITDISINERILEDESIPINDRLELLKLLLENIEDREQITKYIHLIKNGYEDINTSKNACNISNNTKNWEVCKVLKEKKYISSFKARKKEQYYFI